MAEYKTPVTGHAFRYAAIIAGIHILLMILVYLFSLLEASWPTYLSWAVLFVGFYITGHKFRQDKLDGFISYGKSFRVIFQTGLYFGLIMMVYTFVHFAVITPESLPELVRIALEAIIERRPSTTQEELDLQRSILENYNFTWWGLGLSQLLKGLFWGLILGLIYSLIIQKDSPNASPFK